MNSVQQSSFSTVLTKKLNMLEQNIKNMPRMKWSGKTIDYFETLKRIDEVTKPLFIKIKELAERAGFKPDEQLKAFPKRVEEVNEFEKECSSEDFAIMMKAKAWMDAIRVYEGEISLIKSEIEKFKTEEFSINETSPGDWNSLENKETIIKETQKIINAIVNRLLPPWISSGEKLCQVSVQENARILINGKLIPAFLTFSQMQKLAKLNLANV